MKPAVDAIADDVIRLRLLEEADLPLTMAWRNRSDVRQWFLDSRPLTEDGHRQWWQAYRDKADDFVFIIEDAVDSRPIGQIALYHVDRDRRSAELGRLIIGDPAYRGRRLGQHATAMLLRLAAGVFGLDSVGLEVIERNAPALEAYRRCGFVETGRRPGVITMAADGLRGRADR